MGSSGVNLTIRFLGPELLSIEATTDTADEYDAGDCTTTPIGFTGYVSDQRYVSSPGFDV